MSNYVSNLQTKKKFIVLVFRTVDIKSSQEPLEVKVTLSKRVERDFRIIESESWWLN